ncbi:MAG: type II toxin-antitoxin system PemK/MazF family toxin [Candidatus Scalindua sp. AMX11]|nr:MAG: type II toxin-antitoxin system PemK/MazF family toxin [Candidatus Scalindua sp.]NOG82295.1 type II toxin-antitoxin system PemK/MazF family toxin [Planctomycetota bacterium]RZV65903.1 MAG: type II toxin-antitoxin system PemK/MazF family toxin [Candidatus Scalindua sp. SCAELEC01]TDE63561.1 MAG: type II toxin-antitoxin system PemK/MazF family toxin [Candidatus Scalindua sp. AMX11]GJQ60011.1 MAG: mRNA interferase [Candidatus Scalindua sp.]
MSKKPSFRQLEIYWVDLNPTRGAETKKKRPCLILQDDVVNQNSRTVIMAPILPGHKEWPFVVNLKPTKSNGLDKDRHVNLKQLRAVDVSRITDKKGVLENRYMEVIKEALGIVFDL